MTKFEKITTRVSVVATILAFFYAAFINEKAIVVAELILLSTFGVLELSDYLQKRKANEMEKKAKWEVSKDK